MKRHSPTASQHFGSLRICRYSTYHVEFVGAEVFPQGFCAVFDRLRDFRGINMLVDIGNGTMNVMYINDGRPLEKKSFTEKYGTHQCMVLARARLMKQYGVAVDESVTERMICHGTAEIDERYLPVHKRVHHVGLQ